jgi:hypothetical protein
MHAILGLYIQFTQTLHTVFYTLYTLYKMNFTHTLYAHFTHHYTHHACVRILPQTLQCLHITLQYYNTLHSTMHSNNTLSQFIIHYSKSNNRAGTHFISTMADANPVRTDGAVDSSFIRGSNSSTKRLGQSGYDVSLAV